MEFYSVTGSRPVRLSETTRKFAWESLHGKYGRDAMENSFGFSMDDAEGFDDLSDLEKYDAIVLRAAEQAPIRICEGEKISGSATFGASICHRLPGLRNGNPLFYAVSHLTVDFESVLRRGVGALESDAIAAFQRFRGTEKEPFARSCVNFFAAFRLWHGRYLDALRGREEYKANYEALLQVPFQPPRTFLEGVQSLWFTFAFLRLLGDFPGIGRIDWFLGEYLKNDLAAGRITLEEAREVLAHFLIKGCEWIRGEECGSGDAQHYQNLVIGGVDRDGKDVTCEVTYLLLDVLEELPIGDFPTAVRLNCNTEEKLLRRVAEVIRCGGGVLAVYNEDLIVESMTRFGYDLREARTFANDGCWEVQVPGKTNFGYIPFDGLNVLLSKTLRQYETVPDFSDFEDLYLAYLSDLKEKIKEICLPYVNRCTPLPDGGWKWRPSKPCTSASVFERGCIERGISYYEGGAVYNVISPHFGGFADAVNSLYALKSLVFEEKRLSLEEFFAVLRNNWEGQETLRQYVWNKYEYYGNDNDAVDAVAARLLSDFADLCEEWNGSCGYLFPAGISTFGRQLGWSGERPATPFGKRSGEVLAGNCSPTPGTDTKGATAIVCSYCKADLRRMVTGAALDVRLLPSSVKGEGGLSALMGLMRGFVSLGGYFMQLDVADPSILRKAQENPEEYRTLSVRVSGWNARFVTLDRQWQDMVIGQNEHGT